jgi:hypothetical protein
MHDHLHDLAALFLEKDPLLLLAMEEESWWVSQLVWTLRRTQKSTGNSYIGPMS